MVHKLRMRVMSFFGFAFAGIAFVVVAGIVLTMLSMAFGIGTSGLNTITDLASAFVNLEPVGIAVGLIAFLILGFLVWIFGIVGVKIRRAIGVKQDEKVSFGKRPAILAFLVAGVITVIVFAGLSAILNGITQDPTLDLTDVMTLFDAIVTGNPLLFLGALVGLAIIGFLVIKIAEVERPISEGLPDSVQAGQN